MPISNPKKKIVPTPDPNCPAQKQNLMFQNSLSPTLRRENLKNGTQRSPSLAVEFVEWENVTDRQGIPPGYIAKRVVDKSHAVWYVRRTGAGSYSPKIKKLVAHRESSQEGVASEWTALCTQGALLWWLPARYYFFHFWGVRPTWRDTVILLKFMDAFRSRLYMEVSNGQFCVTKFHILQASMSSLHQC